MEEEGKAKIISNIMDDLRQLFVESNDEYGFEIYYEAIIKHLSVLVCVKSELLQDGEEGIDKFTASFGALIKKDFALMTQMQGPISSALN